MSQYPPDTAVESADIPQESPSHRFYANLMAFLSRFFALAVTPWRFAPLIVDYLLLLQSIWGGRHPGPDVVYPMLSVRKRQSGRLASLLLGHCSTVRQYELHTTTPFPEGIDPPCVAVIDLDEVPRYIVKNGYSTRADLYGLTCMVMLLEIMIALVVQVFYLFDEVVVLISANWILCGLFDLFFCLTAVMLGDGTLALARRSGTPTPGSAVFLDQDLTVVLTGNQTVVEAIAETSFNLSSPNSVSLRKPGQVRRNPDARALSYYLLEALCEGAFLCLFVLCWLLFHPLTVRWLAPLVAATVIMACLLQFFRPYRDSLPKRALLPIIGLAVRISPPMIFLMIHLQPTLAYYLPYLWHLLSPFLFTLFFIGYTARNYPIRSAKFLDALGHPQVRKWQFGTLAAAATFQCLVLCHGIARPIRTIEILAFLDVLIPDQRDLWKAWKERVADRIVHEIDILFAPTIPTFSDERQQQLKDLLDQAQFGYDAYRHFYVRHVPLYPI